MCRGGLGGPQGVGVWGVKSARGASPEESPPWRPSPCRQCHQHHLRLSCHPSSCPCLPSALLKRSRNFFKQKTRGDEQADVLTSLQECARMRTQH